MKLLSSLSPVLGNRRFRNYFYGTIVSSVGDGMQFIGIAWLLTQLTGTTSSIGWLLAVSSLSGILFSPWIGILVDRWDRRLTCVGADLCRGAVILVIPALYDTHSLQIWMLYVVAFLVSIGDRFYLPATGGLVREIVPVEDLLPANALSNVCLQIGLLVGSGLGGLIVASFTPVLVMLLNTFSFGISAACTFSIRRGIHLVQTTDKKTSSVSRDFTAGIAYLRSHPYIISIAGLQLILFFALYTTNVLLPIFSASVLQVGSTGFGLIDAASAVGSILGGMLLLFVLHKVKSHLAVTPGMLLLSGSIAIFLTSRGLWQAMVGYLLMGLFYGITRISYDTMIQAIVPTHFQGRVKSTIAMIVACISFSVYLGVGYLGDLVSLRFIYLVVTIIILIGGLLSISLSLSSNPNFR